MPALWKLQLISHCHVFYHQRNQHNHTHTPILDRKQPPEVAAAAAAAAYNNYNDDDDDNEFIQDVTPKISHIHTTRTRAISPSSSSLTAGSMSIGTLSSGRTRSKSPKVPMKSDTR
jgi:hypothetical protein